MSQRRSENELAFAGVILFATGVATIFTLNVLPLYNTGQLFIVALIGGVLIGWGIVLILRSVLPRRLREG